MDYYIYKDDNQTGPFTLSQLQSMWVSGLVTANTLYWQEGSPDWLPLGTINALFAEAVESSPRVSTIPVRYYYSIDGSEVQGPISERDLQEMYSKGDLSEGTQVCSEGDEVWRLLSEVVVPNLPSNPEQRKLESVAHRKPADSVQPKPANQIQPQPTVGSKWTKIADWALVPRSISAALPCCPVCHQRGDWELHKKWGFTTSALRIICLLCHAEWEYAVAKSKDLLFGGAAAAWYRLGKIVTDDSIWILRSAGRGRATPTLTNMINKEVRFSVWKQMVKAFCGGCGSPLAESEKFCPKCGAAR